MLSSTTHHGKLFLFDEPTTGLHFEDVAKLLRAFRKLLAAGHSLLVIEHNLDVIRAADWIIDLGPEGGDGGGEIVCAGTPRRCARTPPRTPARRSWNTSRRCSVTRPAPADAWPSRRRTRGHRRPRSNAIVIHNAREHNLKNIDVRIPRDKFTVITGVSGSGKSTLAFDILFNEGQRRYLESLNAYARQFVQPAARPDVDAIFGIPPTVAIEQRTSRGGRKSTVATLTEIYHFLRLLYVKLGTQYCPDCDVAIEPQSAASIAARLLREYRGQHAHAAGAAGGGAQGLLHGPREVGGEEGLPRPAGRRRAASDRALAAPVALQGTHHRAAGGRARRRASKNEVALHLALARALDFGKGLVRVLPARATRSDRVLHATRLPFLRHAASPNSIRACSPSIPSTAGARAASAPGVEMPGFDDEQTGEEIWWNEWFEHDAGRLQRVRRSAPESGRAERALPRALDRGPGRRSRSSRSAEFFARCDSRRANRKSHAICWPRSARA